MDLARHIAQIAFSPEFGRQMRFIAGPRQSGKTTTARQFLTSVSSSTLYYNWDNRAIRDAYIKNNHFFSTDIYNCPPTAEGKRWVCMDEIHKYPDWKNILKDFFDSFHEDLLFIVTGSARLDMMRKSGDSLTGRYFHFRLNPIILSELCCQPNTPPPDYATKWVKERLDTPTYNNIEMQSLLRYSGFPEPLFTSSDRFHNIWKSTYLDTLIREDLREITQIKTLEKTAVLMQLLPERIGSPLSINSLTGLLNCSFATVANFLNALELGYLIFRIPPYSNKIARSIKKEKKVYFYDWTRAEGEGAKFENYVAMEFKNRLDFWQDGGYGTFELYYVRDRDGRESDFLVVKDSLPWLLIEVKLKRSPIEYQHKKHSQLLGDIPFIQIVHEENVAEKCGSGLYQMSASRFF